MGLTKCFSASVQSVMSIMRHWNCIMKTQARMCHWRRGCGNGNAVFRLSWLHIAQPASYI